MFLAFLYYLRGFNGVKIFPAFIPVLFLILFGLTIKTTISAVRDTQKISDRYWGLTPDWENYCKISDWSSRNLPQDALVACRKPSISFIYGNGKRFFGITRVLSFTGEKFLSDCNKNKWHPYVISTASLYQKPVSAEMSNLLSNGMIAFGIRGDLFVKNIQFLFINIPDSIKEKTVDKLRSINIPLTDNINSLKAVLQNPHSDFAIIYPDSLIQLLLKAKVTHVLEARLRYFSQRKTNETINTVEGFMDLVSFKYPAIMSRIVQMGADDDEPAEIFKLNYDLYELRNLH
jgi:hypothetical protein